jgi:BMFP domain-containing protein YqiC
MEREFDQQREVLRRQREQLEAENARCMELLLKS